jgi:hypothetical protein
VANTREVADAPEVVLPSGVRYRDSKVGGGQVPVKGYLLLVDYVWVALALALGRGWLAGLLLGGAAEAAGAARAGCCWGACCCLRGAVDALLQRRTCWEVQRPGELPAAGLTR